MPRVPYTFLRGLELSGRHPRDEGEWLVTPFRLRHGEGEPLPGDPYYEIEFPEGAVYPHAPIIPPSRLRLMRPQLYRRIRSSEDAVRFMRRNEIGFQASLHIFPSWWTPIEGYIPLPSKNTVPLPDTHCVPLATFHERDRRFEFRNSWGPWGLNQSGIGFIDYEYLDRYGFESWAAYYRLPTESHGTDTYGHCRVHRWVVRDEWDRRIYGFQVLHPYDDERWGWAFVIEGDMGLEIEELYVLPRYRRRGHAWILVERIKALVLKKQTSLRIWVPFADTKRESPETYPAMLKIARELGIRFVRCPSLWAGYFGASDIGGTDEPIEPDFVPSRPKSIFEAVVVAGLALLPSGSAVVENPAVLQTVTIPEVGDSAWDTMNVLRGRLIRKKNRGDLNQLEAGQLEKLQYLTKEALRRKFPGGNAHEDKYDKITARLKNEGRD